MTAPDLTPGELARRLAWARARGHPGYVWPEVAVADWRAACAALGDVVGAVLGGCPGPALTPPADSAALGVALYTTGTGPLLGAWIDQGLVRADEATAPLVALHLERARARWSRIRGVLDAATSALAGAGARPVLLKGAHTALTLFAEPALRPMADVDLLVGPDLLPAAEAALERAGFVRTRRRRAVGRSTWRPAGVDGEIRSVHAPHPLNPISVDLHADLARDFYGAARLAPPPPRWEDAVEVPGAPAGARGLPDPLLFVVLAAHASEDLRNLQLVRLTELAGLGRRIGADGAWAEVARIAERAGPLHLLHPAVSLADALAPGAVDPAFVDRVRAAAPARMRRVVDTLTPGEGPRPERISLEERFMWAHTPRAALGRLRHMILPASAAGSPRALLRIYLDRLHRVRGGRVDVRYGAGGEDPPDGERKEPTGGGGAG